MRNRDEDIAAAAQKVRRLIEQVDKARSDQRAAESKLVAANQRELQARKRIFDLNFAEQGYSKEDYAKFLEIVGIDSWTLKRDYA